MEKKKMREKKEKVTRKKKRVKGWRKIDVDIDFFCHPKIAWDEQTEGRADGWRKRRTDGWKD